MHTNTYYEKAMKSLETAQVVINSRTQRERVLLLITGSALITSIIYSLLISPVSDQIASIQEEKSNLVQQYEATHNQLLILQGGSKSGAVKSSAQQQLEELLVKKNESLLQFQNKIIPPTRIPYLLESMLRDLSNLKLVSMETLERVPFNSNAGQSESSALYKHRVKITFTGEYQNLLRYLKRVEKLPFPIGWESLEYRITRFPQAQIVLVVYMLSSPIETSVEIKEIKAGQKDD